jgi:hypothetical protein
MKATYIEIAKPPKCAPDASGVVRVREGAGYRYTYVDGLRDARQFCLTLGLDLVLQIERAN